MAIVKMQKVAIVCSRSVVDEVLRFLQGRGVMEISESDTLPKEYRISGARHSAFEQAELEAAYQKAQVEFAVNTLLPYASDRIKKQGLPKNIQAIEQAAFSGEFRSIIDKIEQIDSDMIDLERRSQDITNEREMLLPWTHCSYKGSQVHKLKMTTIIFGTVPIERVTEFSNVLSQKNIRAELLQEQREKNAYIVAHVWNEHLEEFRQIASQYNWNDSDIVLPEQDSPADRIKSIIQELKEIELKRNNIEQELRELSKHIPHLRKVRQYFLWLEDEQQAREQMKYSSQTAVLFGWMPHREVKTFTRALERKIPTVEVIQVSPRENEQAPVLLRHHPLLAPFVAVTQLYGLPRSYEFDPTGMLAPFFILFFALCLTDAGYGLILFLIFGTIIWRTGKNISEAPLLWLIFFGGIMAFLVGIPFGGWLGVPPERAPEFLTTSTSDGSKLFLGQVWNLSESAGVTFLQNLAIVLGLIHLSFGMFLAGLHKWIHGKHIAAFWKDFTSHLVIGAGIVFYIVPADWKTPALWALISAVVLLVWGKGYGQRWYMRPIVGIAGLASFTMSMVSNIISYLRLLALGLVTGAIALAVNEVAVEFGALFPIWIAIPVSIAIFFAGHTMSIALNTLGSFVHSARLQFIEFFLQFFEGGGREFRPFRRALS